MIFRVSGGAWLNDSMAGRRWTTAVASAAFLVCWSSCTGSDDAPGASARVLAPTGFGAWSAKLAPTEPSRWELELLEGETDAQLEERAIFIAILRRLPSCTGLGLS